MDKAEELLDLIKKHKVVYDVFASQFRTCYLIAGKTIEEWEGEFKIEIPEDSNPNDCKRLDLQLLGLHQQATFFRAAARAVLQALKKGNQTQYRSKFSAIVAEHKSRNEKLPAAATLESLARIELDDVEGAMMGATIASDFWEDILEHLNYCRRLVENIIIATGIEAKITNRNSI